MLPPHHPDAQPTPSTHTSGDPWILIAPTPIAPELSLPRPLVLAKGLTLGPLPDWFLHHEFLDRLNAVSRDRIQRRPVGLICEYAAASCGDPHPDYEDPLRAWQDVVEEYAELAALALWLDAPRALYVECFAHFDKFGGGTDWVIRKAKYNASGVMLMEGEQQAPVVMERESALRQLHEHIVGLPRQGTILAASHALLAALQIVNWEIRYLMDWVAIEALFGPEDGHEITFRMAQRVAIFLGRTRASAEALRADVAKGYSWRSKVVHGLRLQKLTPEESVRLTRRAEEILREALTKILGSEELIGRFDGREREAYLDRLAFNALPES